MISDIRLLNNKDFSHSSDGMKLNQGVRVMMKKEWTIVDKRCKYWYEEIITKAK